MLSQHTFLSKSSHFDTANMATHSLSSSRDLEISALNLMEEKLGVD